MAIMGMGRGNRSRGDNTGKRLEPAPLGPRPAAAEKSDPQTRQYQLGTYTLEAVDQLTGMTADEIDVVADRVMEGARETEEVLRELAHRVREYGVVANERLANFVKAANGCAELARGMQVSLEQQENQPAAPPAAATEARAPEPAKAKVDGPRDLDLEADIEAIAQERAPPTQPGD